jgi:hypothetical protein
VLCFFFLLSCLSCKRQSAQQNKKACRDSLQIDSSISRHSLFRANEAFEVFFFIAFTSGKERNEFSRQREHADMGRRGDYTRDNPKGVILSHHTDVALATY